ncbi:MAG: hypothetical protein M2R45_04731 [Verrucomicrobia subdivision 3 bacterium]|nr:hypothetical protein [Limisphaerales bacterium]MCS1415751.1 hypothetical protein [Limisphaerales bacterium]
MKRWQFSVALLVGYLAVFQLWIGADRAFIVSSGVLWTTAFLIWCAVAARRGYFLNRIDLGTHLLVILDVLLESLLLEDHSHMRFWLCALGFGMVMGGYRWYLLGSLSQAKIPPQTEKTCLNETGLNRGEERGR